MSDVISLEDYQRKARTDGAVRSGKEPDIFFDRQELDAILNLYGFMVARGEWRDYAISHDRESCCFAVFRRSADEPVYRIVKTPKLARRQGAYAVVAPGGRVLRRGKTLAGAIADLERQRLKLIDAAD
ncbi:MAG: DUF2794 domain-containing protein [Alphaproteobacteria bacterium]|nr:DUF2794 domain-containing protein [Alphaproteobacteria bacterium]